MLMQLTIDAVHWSATYIANGKRAKAILRTDVLGSFIFIAPRAGQLVKSMRRIVGIIGRVTAHCAAGSGIGG